MRNSLLSPEVDRVESLQDASYNRCVLELPQNLESLRARVGSILVGCGIISFLDACSERKRATHSKGSSRESEVNPFNLSLVPLRQASLCLDCETITTADTNCHACGSRALLNVSQVLDRQIPSDLASSGRKAGRQRGAFHRNASKLGRSRGRRNALPLDFSMSENNA
jgi:hypothetical protein